MSHSPKSRYHIIFTDVIFDGRNYDEDERETGVQELVLFLFVFQSVSEDN